MANSIVVVFFYRLQPITTDLISKMHEKSLHRLYLVSSASAELKLPKTSLTQIAERHTDAGGTTIVSYIMNKMAYVTYMLQVSGQC